MSHPEVTIEQGTLRGSIGTDLEGDQFYKFQGIPYAKPPLGELRFKAPVAPEKWSGTFDATKEGDICYHKDPLKNGQAAGSENCLVLNVYTKKLPDGKNKPSPVLFWIHGGGFWSGHGGEELYAPDFLITEDVVVVTINYRLGLFGFLSVEDPTLNIPGNAGLKDQVMALKWVQKNISKFGGDPQNVTIFGESAGGASVHLHVLSPMSKGLFHKAIAQSGCALNTWVIGTKGTTMIAPVIGLEGSDDKTIYNALMQKTTEEIVLIQEKLPETFDRRFVTVVVETESNGAFLTDEPINIMRSGRFNQVPFILGYTTKEGMVFKLEKDLFQEVNFENSIPASFGYKTGSPESKLVAQKLKQFYFGNEEPSDDNITKKFDMLTDCHFLYGMYVTLSTHHAVSKSPTYFYRMSLETELNFFKKLLQITTPGVSHCDDIGYLFKHDLTPLFKPGSIEDISIKKFVKLWTNFAKCGNPTPGEDPLRGAIWVPVTTPDFDLLDIGTDLVPMRNPERERMELWSKMFAESPAAKKMESS